MSVYGLVRELTFIVLKYLIPLGSTLHALRAFEYPRWEDYNYELLEEGQMNRFHWLGNGWTIAERDGTGDRTYRFISFL